MPRSSSFNLKTAFESLPSRAFCFEDFLWCYQLFEPETPQPVVGGWREIGLFPSKQKALACQEWWKDDLRVDGKKE